MWLRCLNHATPFSPHRLFYHEFQEFFNDEIKIFNKLNIVIKIIIICVLCYFLPKPLGQDQLKAIT